MFLANLPLRQDRWRSSPYPRTDFIANSLISRYGFTIGMAQAKAGFEMLGTVISLSYLYGTFTAMN